MVGDVKWNILVTPAFTVKDVIEKLSKRVDSKYKFFELLQTYDDKDGKYQDTHNNDTKFPQHNYLTQS